MRELDCAVWLSQNAIETVEDDSASLLNLQQQDSHEFLARLLGTVVCTLSDFDDIICIVSIVLGQCLVPVQLKLIYLFFFTRS